jgi:hypothetical protein
MFIWLKEASDIRVLINIEQIVRIGPSNEARCVVFLADGQKITVEHSIDSIAQRLAAVTKHPVLAPR